MKVLGLTLVLAAGSLAQSDPALPRIVLVGDPAFGASVVERLKGRALVVLAAPGQALTEKPDILHVTSPSMEGLRAWRTDADLVWATETPTPSAIQEAVELGIIVQDLSATPDRAEAVVDCLRRRLNGISRQRDEFASGID